MLRKSKIDIEDREMLASDSVEWEEDGGWRRDSVMLAAGEVDGGCEGADEEEAAVMMVLAQAPSSFALVEKRRGAVGSSFPA